MFGPANITNTDCSQKRDQLVLRHRTSQWPSPPGLGLQPKKLRRYSTPGMESALCRKKRQYFVGPLLSRRLAVSLDFFLVSPSWPSGTGSFGWGQIFSSWIKANKGQHTMFPIEPIVTNALFWDFQVQEGWASVREKCFGKQTLRRNQITAMQSSSGY